MLGGETPLVNNSKTRTPTVRVFFYVQAILALSGVLDHLRS